MIIVSRKHKYLYYMIPKVASMSIRKMLAPWEGLTWTHPWQSDTEFETVDGAEAKRLHQEGYFSFAFIRNPLDRLVSCYEDKVVSVRAMPDGPHVRDDEYLPFVYAYGPYRFRTATFAEFAGFVCGVPDDRADWHFKSQYLMLPPRAELDFIGLFEWLDTDIQNLRRHLAFPPDIPFTHEHATKRKKWESYYTPQLARQVKNRYLEDWKL